MKHLPQTYTYLTTFNHFYTVCRWPEATRPLLLRSFVLWGSMVPQDTFTALVSSKRGRGSSEDRKVWFIYVWLVALWEIKGPCSLLFCVLQLYKRCYGVSFKNNFKKSGSGARKWNQHKIIEGRSQPKSSQLYYFWLHTLHTELKKAEENFRRLEG